jgi:hypothetical protein
MLNTFVTLYRKALHLNTKEKFNKKYIASRKKLMQNIFLFKFSVSIIYGNDTFFYALRLSL